MNIVLVAAAMALTALSAQAGNYAECILDKMPGTANAPAAFAVNRLCSSEYPGQYFDVEKGSGRGLFGFDNSEACIIKKSRDTVQTNAALMIAAACRCLYDEARFKGEQCAYRPQSFVPEPPQEQPVAVPAPAPTPAPTASPAPRPYTAPGPTASPAPQPYTPPAPRKPSAAEIARQAQVEADLNTVAARAFQDYPFLDTPAGAHVLAQIVRRRDELIRDGVYPSVALTRAVNAFAPAYADSSNTAPARVMPSTTDSAVQTPGFPVGCRWTSSWVWSCK